MSICDANAAAPQLDVAMDVGRVTGAVGFGAALDTDLAAVPLATESLVPRAGTGLVSTRNSGRRLRPSIPPTTPVPPAPPAPVPPVPPADASTFEPLEPPLAAPPPSSVLPPHATSHAGAKAMSAKIFFIGFATVPPLTSRGRTVLSL